MNHMFTEARIRPEGQDTSIRGCSRGLQDWLSSAAFLHPSLRIIWIGLCSFQLFGMLACDANAQATYTEYADCTTAFSTIGSSTATLVIDRLCNVTGSITTPATLSIQFSGGGQLSVATGSTVTILGSITADQRQIFSGSGNVVLSSAAAAKVYPQWFGAKADCPDQVDDSAAIQAAVTAISSSGSTRGRLFFTPGCYYTLNTVNVTSNSYITIEGSGRFNTFWWNAGGSSGTVMLDGGAGIGYSISNKGGFTVKDIALGSTTGPALYFYRSNNHVVNRVFLFSAGSAWPYLRINGGSAGQYDDMLVDSGNTNSPPDPLGYFSTLQFSSGTNAIKIESIDASPGPVVTTEHSFNNIRTGAAYTGHAIDIIQSTTTWAMFGISFTNTYVKAKNGFACWHVDGASLLVSNSDCETQSGTSDAIYVQSSSQAPSLYITNLNSSARLHLNAPMTGGSLFVSNSLFTSLLVDAAVPTIFGTNVIFTQAPPSGAGKIQDAATLGWFNVKQGGPAIGSSGPGEGFTGPNAVLTIAGDATTTNAPILSLNRLQTGQVQKWNMGVNSDKTLLLYDATNSKTVMVCTAANGGCAWYGSTFTIAGSGIISAPSHPVAILRLTSDKTFPASTAYPIFWDSSDNVTQGMWTVQSASDTITIPTGGAGSYCITCSIPFSASTTGTYREVDVYKNGVRTRTVVMPPGTSASTNVQVTVSATLILAAGDTLQCKISSDQTGGPTIRGADGASAWFDVTKGLR